MMGVIIFWQKIREMNVFHSKIVSKHQKNRQIDGNLSVMKISP